MLAGGGSREAMDCRFVQGSLRRRRMKPGHGCAIIQTVQQFPSCETNRRSPLRMAMLQRPLSRREGKRSPHHVIDPREDRPDGC